MDTTPTPSRSSRRGAADMLKQLPALHTGLSITINTREAALFWENQHVRWRLTALSRVWQAQKNDNPWADARLWELDQVMTTTHDTLLALRQAMDATLAELPPGISVSTPDFSQGVSLGQQSASPPVGMFITLFALFNQALLTLLQVRMTGLSPLSVTENWRRQLLQTMQAPLRTLLPGPVLSAAHSTVSRADLLQSTPLGRHWQAAAGLPDRLVLAGRRRSRWQSPLSLPTAAVTAIMNPKTTEQENSAPVNRATTHEVQERHEASEPPEADGLPETPDSDIPLSPLPGSAEVEAEDE